MHKHFYCDVLNINEIEFLVKINIFNTKLNESIHLQFNVINTIQKSYICLILKKDQNIIIFLLIFYHELIMLVKHLLLIT